MKRLQLFLFVIITQVFILNNIQFSGYINPYYYIIFILTIPLTSRGFVLIQSFFIGFIIDVFSNTYGLHSFACVLASYVQLLLKNKVNNLKEGEESLIIMNLPIEKFMFISVFFIGIHHFTLFFLETFSFKSILNTLTTTIASGIFTLLLLTIHKLFISNKR
ncbi:rod shape-determining protein MreD [Flavobacteriales bacterium]|nr:rod shape-determining protein MreD [Flavobacteriales bacterium]